MSGEVSNQLRVFAQYDEDGKAMNVVSLQTSESVTMSFDLSDAINPDDSLQSTIGTTATTAINVSQVGGSELTIANVTLRQSRINFDVTAGVSADEEYTVRAQATTVEGDVISRTGVIHGA